MADIKNINIKDLEVNRGQIVGLPKNAKQVPHFEGYYATSDGRLFSTYKSTKEIAKNTKDKDGYLKATLFKYGKEPHHFRKHRIIAMTFLGECDMMINHKNGIKTDNRIETSVRINPTGVKRKDIMSVFVLIKKAKNGGLTFKISISGNI